jgi:hypothetical protein
MGRVLRLRPPATRVGGGVGLILLRGGIGRRMNETTPGNCGFELALAARDPNLRSTRGAALKSAAHPVLVGSADHDWRHLGEGFLLLPAIWLN